MNDSDCIARFLDGDARAVGRMDDWIRPVVHHRTWLFAGDREDLVQEVHLKLLRQLRDGRFRGKSTLKTYVQATAKYTCLDALRRARVRKTESLESVEPFPTTDDSPIERLSRSQSLRLCHLVLHALGEGCRELFRLVLEQDLSYEEIASHMDVPLGTVKSRLARCRDRAVVLRRELLQRDEAIADGGAT